jgi:hypothetical protein
MAQALNVVATQQTEANEVIMPEKACSICSDNYTAIIRKRVTCKYCKKDICCKCIEQYLLTRSDDAHCIHCRVHYNDKDLYEICTKTYLKDRYFKHRQEILVNRERANLPALQQEAHREKQRRDRLQLMNKISQDIKELIDVRNGIRSEFIRLSVLNDKKNEPELKKITKEMEEYMETIRLKKQQLFEARFDQEEKVEEKKEEPKKFIRRCMKSDCNGFLSTAWKCGLCDWYSCSKCFTVKGAEHDTPHECKEDDLKTAELIRSDSKPCPNCGEFINKSSGCLQMYCVTCQTPFMWDTLKIVTSGPIHNPHYYEMMKRKGALPRNPGDVPCGGFPTRYQLVAFPRHLDPNIAEYFYEFHRLCEEVQDVSRRQFRAHVDNGTTHSINIQFLLRDFTEVKWGQKLAINEKKKKRDAEVQEVFAAFLMVAVNIVNTVQNYRDEKHESFRTLPTVKAEQILLDLHVEIRELFTIMNDAFKGISLSYSYTVPYISSSPCHYEKDKTVYRLLFKNFNEKKKTVTSEANEGEDEMDV